MISIILAISVIIYMIIGIIMLTSSVAVMLVAFTTHQIISWFNTAAPAISPIPAPVEVRT